MPSSSLLLRYRPVSSLRSSVALVTMLVSSVSDERPDSFIRRMYSAALPAMSASRILGTRAFSSKKCFARRTGRSDVFHFFA